MRTRGSQPPHCDCREHVCGLAIDENGTTCIQSPCMEQQHTRFEPMVISTNQGAFYAIGGKAVSSDNYNFYCIATFFISSF